MALRNLNFTLQGDRYVAEETVNADYALHLERKAGGGFYILQRSSDDGMFVSCPLPAGLYNPGGLVQSRPVHRLVFRPWRLSDAHQD